MIAVDIGGSHVSSVKVSNVLKGEISNLRTKKVLIRDRKPESILSDWAENINQTISTTKLFDGQIAIAFPGPFEYEQGIIAPHQNGKFRPLEGFNLREELHSRIDNTNRIHFENDAACFGLGEYFYGQSEKYYKIMALTLGSGIGCAFIESGRAIRNRFDVPSEGEVYHLPFKNRTADDYFSTRWFTNRAADYGIKVNGVKELLDEATEDIKAQIYYEFSNNFYSFFSTIAAKFNTEIIVIGGNITKSWEHFGSALSAEFNKIGIEVRRSQLGEQSTCLGAARSLYNTKSK